MKFYSLLFVLNLLIFSTGLYAQNEGGNYCATDQMVQKANREHPDEFLAKKQLDAFVKQWKIDHAGKANRMNSTYSTNGYPVDYIVPVVFHVLHEYGSENISDAQIKDQLRIWNEDYQKNNADTVNTIPYFQPIAGSMGIEFRLATKDPNGNITNGIDRIVSPLTYGADDGSKQNNWNINGKTYLQVWTCASLNSSPGVLAWAYPPGYAFPRIGVICLSSCIGSIGTSSYFFARVITHETGHCFGLAHTWGSTNTVGVAANCNDDDGVSDTPNTIGWQPCPSNLNQGTCIGTYTVNSAPMVHPAGVPDNIQNYMDYSFCSNMFTVGQHDEVVDPTFNSSLIGLWSPNNLTATGTNDPYDPNNLPLPAPKADFLVARQMVCAGDSVKFTDKSWGGHPTSWSWTFQGGTPGISSDSLPYVKYNTPGTYNVSLTATNTTGSGSITKTGFIVVINSTPGSIPFTEGFEGTSFPYSGVVLNPDGGQTWVRTTTAAYSGSASMMIANRQNTTGAVDQYITPSYDFSFAIPVLTFDYSYALWSSDTTREDALKIYSSIDCGKIWSLRYSSSGVSLVTTTPIKKPTGWVPAAGDWKNVSVNVNTVKNQPNVRFMFESTSAAGQNLYIDNINITATNVGIDNLNSPIYSFEVFPNPAKNQINVNVTLEKASDLKIELFDITGRKITDVANMAAASGVQNFQINERLQNGVYFVRVTTGNTTLSKRVVVMD